MTYLLTSEDRRKLEEAIQLGVAFARADGAFRAMDDIESALSLLAGLPKVPDVQILRIELAHARAVKDKVMAILTGIHALLPPNPVRHGDKVFTFQDPDANNTLRWLKQRIENIEADVAAAMKEHPQP